MKIYDVEGFPNPARVRIALAEKGATDQVEFIPVDVMAGDAFLMADITAFAGLAFADFANVEIPENLSSLIPWRAKSAARPSVAG